MSLSHQEIALLRKLERQYGDLAGFAQLTASTVGEDGDEVLVSEVVADSAVTNEAVPALQDDAADHTEALSDLQATLQLNSEDVQSRFADAAVDLQLAQEQLDAAQQQLDDAFVEIGELDSASQATSQLARDAAAAASSAATNATNASQAASSAQTAADAAKTAAATANQSALDAAGLAATKGRVIVQVSAPTGGNADPNNLWIDISGSPAKNTPNRYNTATSKWEPVSDQKAVDAAAAAASATTAASNAQSTADSAKTTASAAQTAASTAQSTADQAQQTAGTAASNAQAAIVSASAAQSTADTATTNAANAKTAADNANTQALAAAGIANGKGKLIVQVSAPTGSNAVAENLWLDISTDGNGKPRNQPNRYVSYSSLNDPSGVTQIATFANVGTERVVDGMSLAALPVGVQVAVNVALYVSMNLPGYPKRTIARLRDGGLTGPVLASYTFTDKGDSLNGDAERWEYGAYVTPASSTLVITIQSDNENAPEVYASRRLIAGSVAKWVPVSDQKVVDAATAAAAAQSTASSAATAASNAQSSADTAKTAAATAQQTADTARANAATAQTAANAAQSTADTAKTNAATAQSAADNANSQALTAAGIANGKGRVIYQATAPTGANASANNLWIRSSDNIPFTFEATTAKWVQATDKTAVDAAAAAATANTAAGSAKTAADNAASAASAAQQTANQASNAAAAAQTTATGKPQILFGTDTPAGTAPQGSTWFQVDSSGSVIGQWQQTAASVTGSTWTARQIRSETLANVDLGKLTAGTAAIVDAVIQKIAAQTANIQTANISNLFVTSGATMAQATIEALYAQVVKAHKITADMIDVGTLNGVTLIGTLVKTAATGQRTEILKDRLDFYDAQGVLRGTLTAYTAGASTTGQASVSIAAAGNNGSSVFAVEGTRAVHTLKLQAPVVESTTQVNTPSLVLNANDAPNVGNIVDHDVSMDIYTPMKAQSGGGISNTRLQAMEMAVWVNQIKGPEVFVAHDLSGRLVLSADLFQNMAGRGVLPLSGSFVVSDTVAANSSTTVSLPFPTPNGGAYFATPPIVNANGGNSRVTIGISSVTTDRVVFALGNWTSVATSGFRVYWSALPTS